jgi:hypothetical protein
MRGPPGGDGEPEADPALFLPPIIPDLRPKKQAGKGVVYQFEKEAGK